MALMGMVMFVHLLRRCDTTSSSSIVNSPEKYKESLTSSTTSSTGAGLFLLISVLCCLSDTTNEPFLLSTSFSLGVSCSFCVWAGL